ncbi:F420-dependent nadp reductase [Emericellopsis cladophorae]|uniref:F420-dependent nadp reductase n=1 Tax=Emericellopsis cladophorae TaxID=2686198 RepID=A0A9Q0B8V8_9HYPO|nr:F420-dependent nadp reductase [Emericellopsis cladophorae]KAI6778157.1 F420-dependent nadp reductase [Emericellopsis cladophorae]
MRVAIAGSGGVARYLVEELTADGNEVVVLTRSKKFFFDVVSGVEQFIADYSNVESLMKGMEGATTVIVAILDHSSAFVDISSRIIEAAKRSPTVTRLIPSEYSGNIEDFPDMPRFEAIIHEPIRKILRAQTELEYTLLANGWFVDYLIPTHNRHLNDIGDANPVNFAKRTIQIPGTGKEGVDLTAVRDMARAVAKLLRAPSGEWDEITNISGEKSTWNEVAALIKEKNPDMIVSYRTLNNFIDDLHASKTDWDRLLAGFGIHSASGAGSLPAHRVAAQRAKFFAGVKFRTARDVVEEAECNPDTII